MKHFGIFLKPLNLDIDLRYNGEDEFYTRLDIVISERIVVGIFAFFVVAHPKVWNLELDPTNQKAESD